MACGTECDPGGGGGGTSGGGTSGGGTPEAIPQEVVVPDGNGGVTIIDCDQKPHAIGCGNNKTAQAKPAPTPKMPVANGKSQIPNQTSKPTRSATPNPCMGGNISTSNCPPTPVPLLFNPDCMCGTPAYVGPSIELCNECTVAIGIQVSGAAGGGAGLEVGYAWDSWGDDKAYVTGSLIGSTGITACLPCVTLQITDGPVTNLGGVSGSVGTGAGTAVAGTIDAVKGTNYSGVKFTGGVGVRDSPIPPWVAEVHATASGTLLLDLPKW